MTRSGRPIRKKPCVFESCGTGFVGRLRMTSRRMQAVRLLSIAEHLLMVVVQYQALPPAKPRTLPLQCLGMQDSYGVFSWHDHPHAVSTLMASRIEFSIRLSFRPLYLAHLPLCVGVEEPQTAAQVFKVQVKAAFLPRRMALATSSNALTMSGRSHFLALDSG